MRAQVPFCPLLTALISFFLLVLAQDPLPRWARYVESPHLGEELDVGDDSCENKSENIPTRLRIKEPCIWVATWLGLDWICPDAVGFVSSRTHGLSHLGRGGVGQPG